MIIKAAAEPPQLRSLPKEPQWWALSLLTAALGPRVPGHLGRLLGLCPLGDPAQGAVVVGAFPSHFEYAEIFKPYISASPGLFFRAQFFSIQTLGVGDLYLCQALLHDAYLGGGPRP